jgi:glycerol-3-phosphate acyltransferase PlsX
LTTIAIALDAMGGDHGPKVVVPAALKVLQEYEALCLILVGDSSQLNAQLAQHDAQTNERLVIQHASEQVAMDEPPSQALRNKKDSSMRVAIDMVKQGKVQACVSAGNTGALMAIARFVLKTLPGIDRPAILAKLPTVIPDKPVRVLDLGANIDSSADNLFQFAIMGAVLAEAVDNISSPKVGLLNIGEEEIKGNEQVKQTAQLLADSHYINYAGYIEGNAIFHGEVDVVVCDGFVGNVALKASEGVAKMVASYMKQAFRKNWLTKLVGLCALPILKQLGRKIDVDRYNGASLLGLRGIVIKSHGGANINAFSNAIREAVSEVNKNVPTRISSKLDELLGEEAA